MAIDFVSNMILVTKEKKVLPHIFRGNNFDEFENSRSQEYKDYRKLW